MGKNKAQKSSKGSKDSLASDKGTALQNSMETHNLNHDTGDVIAGFDFLTDSVVDSPVAACLRKMAKKDSTTKIKALQDFIALVNDPDVDISPSLNFWSRVYCRLTMCGDHRVRELAQNALASVIAKSGRQFACCLRVVLPFCVLSHADCVATVASAAKLCLELSFNDTRRTQAVLMCRVPIMELIASIIKGTNPYLADKSLGTDEEDTARLDRLLSACLGGWCIVEFFQHNSDTTSANLIADTEEAENNTVRDIITSPEFSSKILKNESPMVLAALHTWVITLGNCSSKILPLYPDIFMSTIFLTPPLSGEFVLRVADVACWHGAVVLLNLFAADFWKQSSSEKRLIKRLTATLSSGPMLPVSSVPFFALPNLPCLPPLSAAVVTVVQSYLAAVSNETTLKLMKNCLENIFSGFQKIRPFHSRHQELTTFVDIVFGCLRCFVQHFSKMLSADNNSAVTMRSLCSGSVLKLFDISLKFEPTTASQILPYLRNHFDELLQIYPGFLEDVRRSLLIHFQEWTTNSNSDVQNNLVFFFNLYAHSEDTSPLNSAFAEVISAALAYLISANYDAKVMEFLSSLSTKLVSNILNGDERIRLDFGSLVNKISSEQSGSRADVISKVILRWSFMLSVDDISRLIQMLCDDVRNISAFSSMLNQIDPKYYNHQSVISLCQRLVTSNAFFRAPEDIGYIFSIFSNGLNCETESGFLFRDIIVALLGDVCRSMLDVQSDFYIGRILQENLLQFELNGMNPIDDLFSWILKKLKPVGNSKASIPKIFCCLVEIFDKASDLFVSDFAVPDEVITSLLVVSLILSCYKDDSIENLLETVVYKKYRPSNNALLSFLFAVRDISLFSKENYKLLVVNVVELFTKIGIMDPKPMCSVTSLVSEPGGIENIEVFKSAIDAWLVANCFTQNSHQFATSPNADHSAITHLKNIVFAVTTMATFDCSCWNNTEFSSSYMDVLLEAVSVAELVTSTGKQQSWLSELLVDLVDQLLFINDDLLDCFVKYIRGRMQLLRTRLAFALMLSGRHSSSAVARFLTRIKNSLISDFDQSRESDVWLLSETVNRFVRSGNELPHFCVVLLRSCISSLLEDLSGSSTPEVILHKIRSFSFLASALALSSPKEITFDEQLVPTAIQSLTSPHLDALFLRDNIVTDSSITVDKRCDLADSTADLALFFNCCLRYTSKLTNIDPILCALCSMLSVAQTMVKTFAKTSEMSNFHHKVSVTRFLRSVSELTRTVYSLFSSNTQRKFKLIPLETQTTEFTEFYQLQYLDLLIQLLLSLWLPDSTKGQCSFFSFLLDNRAVQDAINYNIVSCLCKANSVDVITHVHLEPLFCPDESYLPEEVQTIIGRLSPLMTDTAVNDVRVHLAIYTVLQTLNSSLAGIYLSLSADIAQQTDQNDDFVLTPPRVWLREIAKLTDLVSVAVASDNWRKHPEYVSGYLFAWLLVIRLTGTLPSEVRPPMVNFLRKSPDFQALLANIFALAPADPQSVDPAPFDSLPQLIASSEAVPLVAHLSCYLIKELLTAIPVVVRSWLNDQAALLRRDITAYVSANLSPQLRALEVSKVRQAEFDEAIKVRVMTATGELTASYQTEAVRLDLTIKLPDDYPLSPPVIDCKQNILNSVGKLWLRQLTALLICQNGAVLDALLLWQKLITEKLGKLEECTICYSIVQGGSLNLPKRQCRTCKKKFHSACLFRWFESSGNVTCPLCREQFY